MNRHKSCCWFSFLVFVAAAQCLDAAERVTLPVTRDVWISSHAGEEEGNNGKSSRLKLKGYQEFSLFDVDTAPLVGRIVRKATLHVALASDERLHRVGVSTIGADWHEGDGRSYDKVRGASSFRWKAYPDEAWSIQSLGTHGESDVTSVIFGAGGTLWNHADATDPVTDAKTQQRWQSIPIDPRIVAARVANISYGFVLFDDLGTELVRTGDGGEKVEIRLFPNRFVFSRDQNAAVAPRLEVELENTDNQPPEKPSNISATTTNLPSGEALITWNVPADRGDAGVIGFFAECDGKPIPRELIPLAVAGKNVVTMRLRGLGLAPSQEICFRVAAVDAAGNRSDWTEKRFSPAPASTFTLDETSLTSRAKNTAPIEWNGLTVAFIDELDKPEKFAASQVAANHLWSAEEKCVQVFAARNEWVGFQVLIRGNGEAIRPSLKFVDEKSNKIDAIFSRFEYVDSPKGRVADPVVPLEDAGLSVAGCDSILCELFVPETTQPRTHNATLTLTQKTGSPLEIAFSLHVWSFSIPNALSFFPEMNSYGLPENERDFYRLAQLHRTYINVVPYSHRGTVADGCAPKFDGAQFDWTAWDRRFGMYLDGSAFADLPRGAVPIEAFYLPLHENWPITIFDAKNYSGSPWADDGFSADYGRGFSDAVRAFETHLLTDRAWNNTMFHFYLNNKHDYKKAGWSRASSPWLLDEPASFQDFAALKYFGERFREGVSRREERGGILFRCDLSRPQWVRDSLDDVMDVHIVGGDAFRRYNTMIRDKKEQFRQIVYTYGTTCSPEDGAIQPAIWCVDSWTLGADGVVPWNTIGGADSWKTSDELALFYPSREASSTYVPTPSLRLKSYRRGQQDVEYLNLLTTKARRPRREIENAVRRELNLHGQTDSSVSASQHTEDAGTVRYDCVAPYQLWQLRQKVAAMLER
ncbi:MAG: hypothetical protein ACRC46_00300 [Thermoguttaceae bacterium]